jgi:hypothetical protein
MKANQLTEKLITKLRKILNGNFTTLAFHPEKRNFGYNYGT